MEPQPLAVLNEFADELAELLSAPHGEERAAGMMAALDGGVSQHFRQAVSVDQRRMMGAFFTSSELATALSDGLDIGSQVVADPCCGTGDLLLGAARRLPVGGSVGATLRLWGQQLQGRDLEPELVRLCRIRLALLASARCAVRWNGKESELADLLPQIRTGDGRELLLKSPGILLLNPPFGSMPSPEDLEWGSGQVARAAVFAAAVIEALPADTTICAIMPDVLRSGSRYRRWREHMDTLMDIDSLKLHGQFDPWTDVDVFTIKARRAASTGNQWQSASAGEKTLADDFEVRVGTVVPHRDEETGPLSPYICARDLPSQGEYIAGAVKRRHEGTRFAPPFVAVRRTSRPSPAGNRAAATVVTGSESVLAENHLLVCVPRDGKLSSCRSLAEKLHSAVVDRWFDERIRCRHLTVGALRELPLE